MAFQSFNFERTLWRLFQKRVVRTKFDIYIFTKGFCEWIIKYIMYKVQDSLLQRCSPSDMWGLAIYSHVKTPRLFIEMPVTSQESEWSCTLVLGLSIFASFYDLYIGLWNCSESVRFCFCFSLYFFYINVWEMLQLDLVWINLTYVCCDVRSEHWRFFTL